MNKIHVDQEITLVKLRMKSAREIYKKVTESKEFLRQWLQWANEVRSIADIKRYISPILKSDCVKKDIAFEVWFEKDLAGIITLKEIDNVNRKAEIGYWLTEEYVGKGIMIKSCKSLLDFTFKNLGINKVQIKCSVKNIRSCNIPKQLGFSYEGIEREGEFIHKRFVDLKVYSLLKKEWHRINGK